MTTAKSAARTATTPIKKRSVCENIPKVSLGPGLVEGDVTIAWLTVITTPKLGTAVVFMLSVGVVSGLAVISVTSGVDVAVLVGMVVCAGDPTVNVVLITLLLGFGSLAVDTAQVNVWVPNVAVHGVDTVTVAGTPPDPT